MEPILPPGSMKICASNFASIGSSRPPRTVEAYLQVRQQTFPYGLEKCYVDLPYPEETSATTTPQPPGCSASWLHRHGVEGEDRIGLSISSLNPYAKCL